MPFARSRRLLSIPQMPPPAERTFRETWDYATGAKKVRAAHAVLTLCRFGRWLTRSLCPWLRFLPAWTDCPPEGGLSLEMKATFSLSYRRNKHFPLLFLGVGLIPCFRIKKGA